MARGPGQGAALSGLWRAPTARTASPQAALSGASPVPAPNPPPTSVPPACSPASPGGGEAPGPGPFGAAPGRRCAQTCGIGVPVAAGGHSCGGEGCFPLRRHSLYGQRTLTRQAFRPRRLQTPGGACPLARAPHGLPLLSGGHTQAPLPQRDQSCRSPPISRTPALRWAHSLLRAPHRKSPDSSRQGSPATPSSVLARVGRDAPWNLWPKPRRASL